MAFAISIGRLPVTIASGNSLPLGNKTLVGIIMPSAWTAAALSFQMSGDDSTFVNVTDGTGSEISPEIAAG